MVKTIVVDSLKYSGKQYQKIIDNHPHLIQLVLECYDIFASDILLLIDETDGLQQLRQFKYGTSQPNHLEELESQLEGDWIIEVQPSFDGKFSKIELAVQFGTWRY